MIDTEADLLARSRRVGPQSRPVGLHHQSRHGEPQYLPIYGVDVTLLLGARIEEKTNVFRLVQGYCREV